MATVYIYIEMFLLGTHEITTFYVVLWLLFHLITDYVTNQKNQPWNWIEQLY